MPYATNPFIVLSYVSGPAILTNASALLLMSTSNPFARVVDRSRMLAREIEAAPPHLREQLLLTVRRVRLISRALTGLYVAVAGFAMATLISIIGALGAALAGGLLLEIAAATAILFGIGGFVGFVLGTGTLLLESRLAVQSIKEETDEALKRLTRAN
ncbi:MAG TPA: DUF2721 domain-containing protein [Rhizomicrobium sp.]|jgi:hypothetical protein|nr:DUF2721 domain-containing protein [Rhizomicrobium sp.]